MPGIVLDPLDIKMNSVETATGLIGLTV